MQEYTTTGMIQDGQLAIQRREDMQAALRRMKNGTVLVSVQRLRAARSLNQNAWYWGVVVDLLSEHTGYTPDEVHEVLKAKFLPKKLAIADGNGEIKGEYVVGGSTTKLDTQAFMEYCSAIQRWAAEDLGLVIPDPHEG